MDANHIMAMDEYTSHATPSTEAVEALAADMEVRGWVGAPVLTYAGKRALSGTHRIHAARVADIDVPTLDLGELIEDADARIVDVQAAVSGWEACDIATALMVIALGEDRATEMGLDCVDDVAALLLDIEEMTA